MSKALEAAVKAAHKRGWGGKISFPIEEEPFDANDARAIILAFLDAAAGDEETRLRVGFRALDAYDPDLMEEDVGIAAILALKEAANG